MDKTLEKLLADTGADDDHWPMEGAASNKRRHGYYTAREPEGAKSRLACMRCQRNNTKTRVCWG